MEDQTFIGRQPIMDAKQQIIGYELFFRHSADMYSFSRLLKAVSLTLFTVGLASNALMANAICTANTSPVASCTSLDITGVVGSINVGIVPSITVDGSNAITVNGGSTGLDLTVQADAIVGITPATLNGLINYGAISSITNKGNIQGNSVGINSLGGTITTITNEGTGNIAGGNLGIFNDSTIGSITNQGTISSSYNGIDNYNTISTITNQGTIFGVETGIYNDGTITSITNQGTISGGVYDILNYDTIEILNNLQGASSNALSYEGSLPTIYNIIVNSSSNYGKLSASGISGVTTFGISSLSAGASIVSGTPYTSVLSGVTNADLGIIGTNQAGTSNGYTYLLSTAGGNIWDLIISAFAQGPSAADTQASLQQSARKLRSIFNLATVSSNFANMNTYDCNLFDTKGTCISAGGRYTTVDNPDSNTTSAVVVVGYKATPNIRIGGFLDQNVNNNTPSGINISNKNPLMGAFVVWNQNQDGLGYQVKLANAYQDKNVDTTREVIGTSEAGKGSTDLTTQSYVGELSYAFNYNDKTLLRPYLALRHTTIKQDAYTETGVATPLSYDSLEDRSTTALLGLKLNHKLTPKTTLTASLGIEQDLEHRVDDYSATSIGISGLTSENFNDNIKRTRPVASAGAYYAVSKTQRIAGDIYYQQLPFQSTGSTTAYFNYTIGF
jgi:hypothetical protein